MKTRHLFALAFASFYSLNSFATPVEIVVTGRVLSVRDNQTRETNVVASHKVRVESKIYLEVRGYNNGSLGTWIEKELPRTVNAYFEREDQDSGLITRFRTLPFRLQDNSVRCTRDYDPEYRVCKAEYSVSKSNEVDVPPGRWGQQAVSLQVVAPDDVGIPVRIARTRPKNYSVLTGEQPQLSMQSFTGLPQH